MANKRQSIKSFLTVVVFLVLTAIVAVIYGGSDVQKDRLDDNIFYQKTRLVLDTIWAAAQGLGGLNLNRNLGVADDIASQIKTEVEKQGVAEDITPWAGLFSSIKEEWKKTSPDSQNSQAALNSLASLATIEDSDAGRQLVLHFSNSREYRLAWPFKKNSATF